MEYRLAKVAAEFNVSIKSIVNFLRQKGYVVEPKPTTTITHDIYQLLANDMDFLEIQKKFHAINNHIIVKHEFSDSDQLEAKDKELKSAETSTKDLQGNISLNEISLSHQNKYMETISFENFRRFSSFDPLEYGPITFFVGSNNSGKSTVVKALMLVLNYLKSNAVSKFNLSSTNIDEINIVTYGRAKTAHSIGDFISFEWQNQKVKFEVKISGKPDNTSANVLSLTIQDLEEGFNMHFEPQESQVTVDKHKVLFDATGEEDSLLLRQLLIREKDLKETVNLIDSKTSDEFIKANEELGKLRDRIKLLRKKIRNVQVDAENFSLSSFYTTNDIKSIIEEASIEFKNEYQNQFREIQNGKKGKADFEHYLAFEQNAFKFEKKVNECIELIQQYNLAYLGASLNKQTGLFAIRDKTNPLAQAINEYQQLNISPGDEANRFVLKWMDKDHFDIGEGYTLKMHAGEAYEFNILSEGKEIPLADKGMGSIQAMLLILRIATIIHQRNKLKENFTVIIEEPELNLHPAFQSRLADLFLDVHTSFKIKFIIETHSEYILRRTQVIVADNDLEISPNENPFCVYYFPGTVDNLPYRLNYQQDGTFDRNFGQGFFDEASSSTLKLLKLKRLRKA